MLHFSGIARCLMMSLVCAATGSALLADHGPGTSGGGVGTQSGEVLKAGTFSLGARVDFTVYESLSEQQIEDRTLEVGSATPHFDAARWTMLQSYSLTYGFFDNFEAGLTFGLYHAEDLREGHVHDDGSYEFHSLGDVTGMTDPWLNMKLRLFGGQSSHFSLLGGVKFPWGDDDEIGDGEDEPLEPSVQPGTDSVDYSFGIAYSTWLSEQVTFDGSIQHTVRANNGNFKVGDITVYSLAMAYRLTETAMTFPRVTLFGEVTLRDLYENEEDGEGIPNSGGPIFFVSPGARLNFCESVAASFAAQFPVIQNLNDVQQETEIKYTFALNFAF